MERKNKKKKKRKKKTILNYHKLYRRIGEDEKALSDLLRPLETSNLVPGCGSATG